MSCGYVSSCQPPCVSYPVGGVGSLCSPCGGGFSGGLTSYGGGVPSSSLGLTSGANVGCLNQIPPSAMYIQPPSCVVTIPGAVLAATCEPVKVGGCTACAGGSSYGGGLGFGRSKYSCGY